MYFFPPLLLGITSVWFFCEVDKTVFASKGKKTVDARAVCIPPVTHRPVTAALTVPRLCCHLSPESQHPPTSPCKLSSQHRKLLCGVYKYLARRKLYSSICHRNFRQGWWFFFFWSKLVIWQKNKALYCSQKSLGGVEKISVCLQLKHRECCLWSTPPLLHSCLCHFGLLLFQRDEETCPTLAPACSCTSGRPGLPGPPGPPVSSPFHAVYWFTDIASCSSGMSGMRRMLLGLREDLESWNHLD